MNNKRGDLASAVTISNGVIDKLEQLLTGPNDRAFVICSHGDCNLNVKGQCTIFTVLDVPRMKTGQRCDRFVMKTE